MIAFEHIDSFFERFEKNDRIIIIIDRKYRIWNYFGNKEFDNEIILSGTELYDHVMLYFIEEKLKS